MKTIFVKILAPALLFGAAMAPVAVQADPYHHTPVNARLRDQQHRIGEGIRSGQLTPREAARIERREGRVRREIYRDRYYHHGHLTAREHRHIERQLNRDSHAIYRQKHDAQHGY
jgi:hypothetical protein